MQPKQKRAHHNIYNRIVSRTKNSTGLAGVSRHYNDFVALIRYQGRVHRIGIYRTAIEAHKAYLKTAHDLGIKIKLKK